MAVSLRPYQRELIDAMYRYYDDGGTGNPCIVASTGAGKTVIIAKIIEEVLMANAKARIIVLTHRKELIEQDAQETEQMIGSPVAVFSASCGRKEIGQITFGGIQSVARSQAFFYGADIAIVDEAHLINHNQTGQYRTFLAALKEANPSFVVIGLTATPYRLGHGKITEGDALFDRLIETPSASVDRLIADGYLSNLRAKATKAFISADGVAIDSKTHDYNQKQLQSKCCDRGTSEAVVNEVISMAGNRKAWLFFCTGIEHAKMVAEILRQNGIPTACVTSETTDRTELIQDFKSGKIRAVTNVDVLSTGFNYPVIDLIVLMRPTMSAGLYVQQVGRGLRKAEGKEDCLVLDFVGNVAKHGAINHIIPPTKNMATRNMTRTCPKCGELVPSSKKVCTCCGYEWETVVLSKICPKCDYIIPANSKTCPHCHILLNKEDYKLHDDDLITSDKWLRRMSVDHWRWTSCKSKVGNPMLMVTYFEKRYGGSQIREFFILNGHEYAMHKAYERLQSISTQLGIDDGIPTAETLNRHYPPDFILYEHDEKNPSYPRIVKRIYSK